MRFIGNKELIAPEIKRLLAQRGLADQGLTFFDAFCGTGAVADLLKDSFSIVLNDMLTWCVTYSRGRLVGSSCKFETLGFDPFIYLNQNATEQQGFFYRNYSPGGSARMYFTPENAGRIDYFRATIESWRQSSMVDEDEFGSLITGHSSTACDE